MAEKILSASGLEEEVKLAKVAAAQGNKRIKIRDGNNLMLMVRPSGGASWVLEFREPGRNKKPHTLGKWPDLTLAAARRAADTARQKIVIGKNPNAEREATRVTAVQEKARASYSVKHLMDDWLENAEISDVYEGNIRAAFVKDVLPAIGFMAPGDVTTRQITDILRLIDDRGSSHMLKNVRMWIRHMFEYGVDDERIQIATNPTPGSRNKSFKKRKGGNYPAITEPIEASALMSKVETLGSTLTRNYLRLAAHLFQRPSELRMAPWSEFDLENAKWTIPKERMKKNREHWVPLSPIVIDLLRKHQGVVGDEGLLFPGRSGEKPMSEATPEHAIWTLGFKGRHCPHGFRAMANTILTERMKVDSRFIEKQLSHEIENKTEAAYNRAEFWDDRVLMMDQWSRWLQAATKPLVSESNS